MHQLLSLSLLFIAWKGLVLTTAWCAPGLGYDTSTTLLPSGSKLVRWDAIYYVHKAQYGEVFEQEWAFGKGLSTVMSTMSSQNLNSTIAAGVLLAHASHFISVLVLWAIANTLRARSRTEESLHQALPFVAACLHILSPAGIFLSAPYAESPFSCLNMLGIWFYLQSHTLGMHYLLATRSGLIVISGICFGLATIIRSNGILSGIPVLLDAVELMWKLISGLAEGHLSWSRLCLLTASVCSGLCVAMGLIVPQYLAHQEYCTATETVRPWCYEKVPMIYSFVQSHYWCVDPEYAYVLILMSVGASDSFDTGLSPTCPCLRWRYLCYQCSSLPALTASCLSQTRWTCSHHHAR